MNDIRIDSKKVEELITEVIKLEKQFIHQRNMLEREKVAAIKKLIVKEVDTNVD